MKPTNISIKQASNVSIIMETLKQCNIDELTALLEEEGQRTARRMERMVNDHPTATNIILWLLGIGLVVEIFMFA